jgi:hypothetical protein
MAKNTAQRYQTAREVAAAATAALDEAATEVRTESTIPEADSAEPAPPTVCWLAATAVRAAFSARYRSG